MYGMFWNPGRGEMVLEDLDGITRAHMKEELRFDTARGCLFLGESLSPHGRGVYPELLRKAIEAGTPSSFAAALRRPGVLLARARRDAAEMLAEGELNRFYIRGVCRRAIEEARPIEVYRARRVAQPRPESEALIGKRPNPDALLGDLRGHVGKGTYHRVPGGPNSGLSVRLVRGRP